jgi:hypothetical protein
VSRAARTRTFAGPRRLACGHWHDRAAAKRRAWLCPACALRLGWLPTPFERARQVTRDAERAAG